MSDELDTIMAAHAERAVEFIEQCLGHRPDFTPDSIVLVEAMAGCIHLDLAPDFLEGERKRNPWDKDGDEELQGLYLMLGGYIGEVIRHNFGGDWLMEEPAPASPPVEMLRVFPGLWLDPLGWVRNRLLIGAEHNVFAIFEAVVSENALAPRPDAK
jgi:hypothetical protein